MPKKDFSKKAKDTDWYKKPATHSCTECQYKSKTGKDMERHKRNHERHELYKCCFCSYSSPSEAMIHRHISRYHTDKVEQLESEQSDGEVESENATDGEAACGTGENEELSLSFNVRENGAKRKFSKNSEDVSVTKRTKTDSAMKVEENVDPSIIKVEKNIDPSPMKVEGNFEQQNTFIQTRTL